MVMVLVVLGTSIWVWFDARTLMARIPEEECRKISGLATSPFGWAIGCVLLWLFVFPRYLFVRRQYAVYSPLVSLGFGPQRCPHCSKFYEGLPAFCPQCGQALT